MSEPITPGLSEALAPDGSQTAFIPTTDDLRRLWTSRVYSNAPEKIEMELGFDSWLADHVEAVEVARHDMPADLFNELSEVLLHASLTSRSALILLDKIRERYGASTRRRLGLSR